MTAWFANRGLAFEGHAKLRAYRLAAGDDRQLPALEAALELSRGS